MKGRTGSKKQKKASGGSCESAGGAVNVPGAYKSGGEAHGKKEHRRADKKARGGWIKGAIKHPGVEKKAAAKAGVSTHEYMEKHKHDSGKSGARARLGLTLSKMSKK